MKQAKARQEENSPLPGSESWNKLPWRKFEQHVYRLQKRIFQAEQHGNTKVVRKLQKLLMKSRAARLLAVRRVTQDNQGKNTAGIDGVKAVTPKQRLIMAEHIHPKHWRSHKTKPVRRVYIPKPGKPEKRPLGIPVMQDRAQQALVKMALEPQWEGLFEPNSYGFRPGRSCHDAIAAIHVTIAQKAKYVLDADLKGCFDNINHEALLYKLRTFPALRRKVKAWLKAGCIDNGVFEESKAGTPQGGVISPLLANIALHGMETCVQQAFSGKEGRPHFVRYADDFVVFHPTLEGVQKAQRVLEEWIKGIGLEMKPSKTKITHTLEQYQGQVGFDFLGWYVRQYPVGRNRSAKVGGNRSLLGFKTFIKPSQEAVKRHMAATREVIRHNRAAPQGKLIKDLNPIIKGWTNYHRTVVAKETFSSCDHFLYLQLASWAQYRHPNKGKRWVAQKYWHIDEGQGWKFSDGKSQLSAHSQTAIRRHAKVRGTASPYDGNLLYWSQRLSKHPLLNGTKAKLLQKQGGKCRWCELLFKDGDILEIDHITPKSEGGGEELSNKWVIHRHCHDNRHAKRVNGTYDKGHIAEEPCEAKVSCTVLQTSAGGDSCA
jgi:RNA-directed DNA polymerase